MELCYYDIDEEIAALKVFTNLKHKYAETIEQVEAALKARKLFNKKEMEREEQQLHYIEQERECIWREILVIETKIKSLLQDPELKELIRLQSEVSRLEKENSNLRGRNNNLSCQKSAAERSASTARSNLHREQHKDWLDKLLA